MFDWFNALPFSLWTVFAAIDLLSAVGMGVLLLWCDLRMPLLKRTPALRRIAIPYAARLALPALRDRAGIAAVPALSYVRAAVRGAGFVARFAPPRPLAAAAFAATPQLEPGASTVV